MKVKLNSSNGRASQHSRNRERVGLERSIKTIGQNTVFSLCIALSWGVASAKAAERLTLRLGPFEQSVAISELETFAKTGDLPPKLQVYGAVLTPQVRQILTKHLQIDPNMTDKFLNDLIRSSDGARLLEKIGLALPESRVDQLKAALFLAARQANGLSVISFLKAYPEENVTIDASEALSIALQFNASYWQSLAIGPMLKQELAVTNDTRFRPSFDPTEVGAQYVREQTLMLRDQQRQRNIPVDLYWARKTSGPLVILSHGFGSDRNFLTYIARHLASHGFTVASIEHPGSNLTWLSGISLGGNPGDLLSPSEFIDRPKDVSFVLDEFAKLNLADDSSWQGKLNTQQVTVIGHSLGGYTALALAGGEINLKELRQFCKNRSPIGRSPADWFQCAATDLPGNQIELRDRRVVQVMALNPMTGRLFGNKGLAQVTVPTLVLTSTEDAIAPSLDHQLRSFSQLGGPKYLISAIGGTHLSITDRANLNEALAQSTLVKEHIGKEADPLRQLLKGVSLAFVKQLTPEAQRYQPFLSPAYAQSLSTPTITLRFSKELPTTMSTWFQVLAVGNQQVAISLPRMNEFPLISAIKSFFFPSNKVVRRASSGTEKLYPVCKELNNYDDKPSTDFS
ncbi:alpha/beta hydrolase [Allocoleopsis franciscana]|uniref:Putative dienelactone hydrolase n=1 Tax=Allocoleopsis franciscana PCC 7113 TaxID=1173027 RepID=K9WM03_9CYAN|nr:alpha/beta hydrolase [Allocoleopsis franciscana]AFZ21440.1 putative dienelactone hydrolase [Allocoleopsis franciscana PCC 7113]